VDNRAIAQVLGEIADLLEIKGDNAFKIRAYRSASETIAAYPDAVSRVDDARLREIPGIGKDLAARIRELAESGASAYHRELLDQFPQTILDLLRLQGVGPKTVALLYSALNISSIEALAAAARDGRLRSLKGMGPKKEALILKAIEHLPGICSYIPWVIGGFVLVMLVILGAFGVILYRFYGHFKQWGMQAVYLKALEAPEGRHTVLPNFQRTHWKNLILAMLAGVLAALALGSYFVWRILEAP
jgi:predicted flap endonuclease-1-like 5' DNA nuclease